MSEEVTERHEEEQHHGEFGATSEFHQESGIRPSEESETAHIRAARAKLIEETTYRLTDLFTIVSARIEMLSDKVPPPCREELAGIRKVLLHGVELNKRLHLVVADCRRTLGIQRQLNCTDAGESVAEPST